MIHKFCQSTPSFTTTAGSGSLYEAVHWYIQVFSLMELWFCVRSFCGKIKIIATIYSLFLRWSWCLTAGKMSHIQFLSIVATQALQKPYVVSSSHFSGCSKLQMIEQSVLLWSTAAAGPVGGTPQQQLRAWDDTAEPSAGGQAERWSVTVCEQCDWLGMRQGRRPTQKTNGSTVSVTPFIRRVIVLEQRFLTFLKATARGRPKPLSSLKQL